MPEQYYKEAQKLAMKEYRSCVSKGLNPILPVLDDFIPAEKLATGIRLGVIQIPAEFIVGTKTLARTNSFARNFMPLLSEHSEFAVKWQSLCSSHLSEGIRDPIKVYEYMNRYYVEEGNKRVSVLKFFDAVNISADVIRILPSREAPETELYYEFVSFYKYSRINYIEFTKKGSYERLQQLLGKAPDEPWTEDERRIFSTAYHYFRTAYEGNGGRKLASTVGDALLAYIKIYGYHQLCSAGQTELKRNVAKMWEEIRLQQEETPIELMPDPAGEKKPSIISRVLPSPKPLKVAFLYDKTPERSGWTNGHELGRKHVELVCAGKVETKAYPDVMSTGPEDAIAQAIADGCGVIFTTSPRLYGASLHAAVEHPETVIMNCSVNKSHRYIRTYYARMYEAKFIIGAVAGALCRSGRIGYIGDYPIFGQIAGVNAFALGARMTNPEVKVVLEWSSVGGRRAAISRLTNQNLELISAMDNSRLYDQQHDLGLYRVTAEGPTRLAAPTWKWGAYYAGLLTRILDGTIRAEYESSSKALNYYWGMSAGVIDLQLYPELPASVRRLALYLREGFIRGFIDPFIGPIHIQGGGTVGEEGESFGLEQIIGMDYLVENIEGRIPVYDELGPTGKATVENVGVESAKKPTSQD